MLVFDRDPSGAAAMLSALTVTSRGASRHLRVVRDPRVGGCPDIQVTIDIVAICSYCTPTFSVKEIT
jgi:hypothetical protein